MQRPPIDANGLVAGVDEAGRGPLAGPVLAAAVVFGTESLISGLDDSKKLAPARRIELAASIRERALAWCVASADVEEIDRLNILNATLLAMRRAIAGLQLWPGVVLVDGNRLPDLTFGENSLYAQAIVRGDSQVAEISAASILAKVARDRLMVEADAHYPGYGFARHKGYGTEMHRRSIEELGPCSLHRRSFRLTRDAVPGPAT